MHHHSRMVQFMDTHTSVLHNVMESVGDGLRYIEQWPQVLGQVAIVIDRLSHRESSSLSLAQGL